MAWAIAMGVASIASSVFGGLSASKKSKKAKKAMKMANFWSQKLDKMVNERNISQAIRATRIMSARIKAQAENMGVAASSGAQGALGSLQSQLGGEIGFARRSFAMKSLINQYQMKAGSYQAQAQDAQAMGNLASSIFGSLGGMMSGPTAAHTPAAAAAGSNAKADALVGSTFGATQQSPFLSTFGNDGSRNYYYGRP